MKSRLHFLLGVAVAIGVIARVGAQNLSPTGVSASPGSGAPGDSITYTVSVGNSDSTNAFTGSANFTIVLQNLVTHSSFTVGPVSVGPTGGLVSKATSDPTTGQTTPGTGSFSITATLPTKTLEAGNYSATVTLNSVTQGTVGTSTFSVTTSVLTVTGKPDLAITGLTYPAGTSYVGADIIPMSLSFTNNQVTNGVENVPFTPGLNGQPQYVRIQVILSSNPTFGDSDDFQLTYFDISAGSLSVTTADTAGNRVVAADNSTHTIYWNQKLPGNFAGSYYVMAKVDSLGSLDQNDPPALTVNGNNVWGGNTLNPSGTLINLLPSNFQVTSLVSHSSGATTSDNGYSDNPSMSSDGRYVAFASDASNLVSNDTNSARDVFLFDNQTGTLRRLSVSQQGVQGNGASNDPSISGAGRYTVFASDATNLVFGDTNGFTDIFVVDNVTGLLTRVSVDSNGNQSNNPSFRPRISSDGRFIVFESTATNLDSSYTVTAGTSHIYVHDRDVAGTGTFDTSGNTSTRLVDADATAPMTTIANAAAIQATISSDGSMIAFASKATNLVTPASTAGRQHAYVRPRADVGTATSGVKLVSVANGTAAEGNGDSQTPSLSSDGHYVAFASRASNLVAGDANGVSDIFVYDTTAPVATPVVVRVSVATNGAEGVDPSATGFQLGSINPTISATGRYVAFASLDSNLSMGDAAGQFQGSGAAATAALTGGAVTSVAVTSGGGEYSQWSPPGVVIYGGGGSGATGAATVSAAGVVTGVTVLNGGSGYTSAPTVVFASDANNALDIFVHDRDSGGTGTYDSGGNIATTLVSANTFGYETQALLGTPSTAASNIYPVISSDGRFVAFPSDAENTGGLAMGATNESSLDSNGFRDVFLADRRTNTLPNPGNTPVVTITSPGAGSNNLVNTAIPITASATTSVGVVSSVAFYVNGTLVGTSTTFPYSATWTPTAVGAYTLSAIVTDSFGNSGVSSNVSVNVVAAPSVGITNPVDGATITAGTSVNVTAVAAASNPGATITSVQFRVNGSALGAAIVPPAALSVAWTPTSAGTFALTAVATDSVGTQSVSPTVSVTVVTAGGGGGSGPTPPTVSIDSPGSGTVLNVNTPTTIHAAATLAGGTVSSVQFLANGIPVGTASAYPYSVSWTPLTPGTYALTALATGDNGGQATSSPVTITVSPGTAPSVSISAPVSGTSVSVGTPQIIVANATPGTGTVASVAFYANGILLGSSTAFPYNQAWTPATIGTFALTAVATDTLGNTTTSAPVTVTVNPVSSSAPTVNITSPANGASLPVGLATPVTASASAASGSISSVAFFVDGMPLATSKAFPFTVQFTPSSPGQYVLTAQAKDNGGNLATSAPVTVSVSAGTAPSVVITSPAASDTIAVNLPQTITAAAVSTTGTIKKVEFFVNGVSVGARSVYPYSVAWTPLTPGTYTVTAQATDNIGNMTGSAPITLTAAALAAPTVSITNPSNGSIFTLGTQINLTANATSVGGSITRVEYRLNGALLGTGSAGAPFALSWTPASTGTYTITAVATNNTGLLTVSVPVTVTISTDQPPSVSISNPANNASVPAGAKVALTATASDADGTVSSVRFFANGTVVASAGSSPFTGTWMPTVPGVYLITAEATDNSGTIATSSAITVNVTMNFPPSVSLTSPAPGYSTIAGMPVLFRATASDSDDAVANVRFLVNGIVFGDPVTTAPYTATWTPSGAGTFTVQAEATDAVGNVTDSIPATVTVVANQPPIVSLTAPSNGSTVRVGTAATLTAAAKDVDGSVVGVQFYVNGVALGGPVVAYPYTTTWTPPSEGIYQITATAEDNGGATTDASAVTVLAVSPTALASDNVYSGPFSAIGDTGRFEIIASGTSATFIGYSTGSSKIYYFPDLTIDATGGFTGSNASGDTIAGSVNDTGATVTLDGNILLIGIATNAFATSSLRPGHYSGSLVGIPGSDIEAIVGSDGAIAVYLANGSFVDAAAGTLTAAGKAALKSALGNPVTVSIDPAANLLTGTFGGSGGGSIMAGLASGPAFSDGSLRNLSTRGQIGTGENVLIVGFVVAGTTPKDVLVRAVGPSLGIFGVSGTISDPQLQLFKGSTQIGFNDNWGNDPAISAAFAEVGAFPLDPTSRDSAILMRLDPGQYSAIVSGVGGATGIGLVELYDVDNPSPFSPQKLINISSRGLVGTGDAQLVAGFVVSGNIPKKVLIRGIGPSLSSFGVTSGYLADPTLRLTHMVNGTGILVRENDDWWKGNDPALVTDAESKAKAFPLASGSKDAAILITLPPGVYTAQVTGSNNTAGVGLIEIYEVP